MHKNPHRMLLGNHTGHLMARYKVRPALGYFWVLLKRPENETQQQTTPQKQNQNAGTLLASCADEPKNSLDFLLARFVSSQKVRVQELRE